MGKTGQARGQSQVVTGEPRTWIISTDGVDLPMQALTRFAKVQVGGLMKQRLQVKGRVFAD